MQGTKQNKPCPVIVNLLLIIWSAVGKALLDVDADVDVGRRRRRDEGFENNKNLRGALIVIGRGRCFLCFAAKKKVVSGCGAGLPRWNARELL